MAGFFDIAESLETQCSNFSAENSRKSPADSHKTHDFWRLVLETEEQNHCVVGMAVTWRIFWTKGIETTALRGSDPDELPGLMSAVPVLDILKMSAA